MPIYGIFFPYQQWLNKVNKMWAAALMIRAIIVMKIERPVQERGNNILIKNPPFSTAVMGDIV